METDNNVEVKSVSISVKLKNFIKLFFTNLFFVVGFVLHSFYFVVWYLLYGIFLPFKYCFVALKFIVVGFLSTFSHELFVVFHVMLFICICASVFIFPDYISGLEKKYKKPANEILLDNLENEVNKLDFYPFNKLRAYKYQLITLENDLTEYKIKSGEIVEPVANTLENEANNLGIPLHFVWGIVKNENSGLNQYAVNINDNKTYDVGIMQINSTNFEYCGINPQQAFNQTYNIRCGMKILKDAYSEAISLASNRKYRSCTNASDDDEFVEEYTARIYNGGSRVFSKGNTSCDYARKFRINLGGKDVDDDSDSGIFNVFNSNEDDNSGDLIVFNGENEEREEKGFWDWIF